MPKRYCGNKTILPDGYDVFGTLFECLRKGYGICKATGREGQCPSAPRQRRNTGERAYCGTKQQIPDGFTRRGTRHECLKKGFGACMYSIPESTRFFEIHRHKKLQLDEWLALIVSHPRRDEIFLRYVLQLHRPTQLYQIRARRM